MIVARPRHPAPTSAGPFNPAALRDEFPTLHRAVAGGELTYLDSAASSLTPRVVIEALERFYRDDYANIHRAGHQLAAAATAAYEGARARVQRFINAASAEEVVFVRSCTEALNLVATSYGGMELGRGDEVLVSEMEHHSNFLPWQRLCHDRGADFVVAPIDDRGELQLDRLQRAISPRTKIVAVAHVSNALGTINPLRRVIELAHAKGAKVVVDGAQGAVHLPVDVRQLDCDFYAFSGHKLYGPTGIGVLYGKAELLASMPPFQLGGGMVDVVKTEGASYLPPPLRFEAGTPHIAGAVGLAAAIDFIDAIGLERVAAYERDLLAYLSSTLASIDGVTMVGRARHRASVQSFVVEGTHPADVATLLDEQGVALRAGHHCAQPVLRRLGHPTTVRASLGVYNTRADIDRLAAGLRRALALLTN